MEQTNENSKAGKNLGIAGMVLGIVAVVISFVPCLGMYALIPGIIGLVLSVISVVQANKAGAAKGMAIAGIVCSLVGSVIAGWQYSQISSGLEKFKDGMENLDTAKLRQDLNTVIQDMSDSTSTH